jgi:hypothetical protein
MERVLDLNLQEKHTDRESFGIVAEVSDFCTITKRSGPSSASKSSHSKKPGVTKNENGNRRSNDNNLKRLFFVFTLLLTKWSRIEPREIENKKLHKYTHSPRPLLPPGITILKFITAGGALGLRTINP